MYWTSSKESRKLTGTSTRPKPHTPKNAVKRRALLWDTKATRSPTSRPSWSCLAAIAAGELAHPCIADVAQGFGRLVRLVRQADAVGVDRSRAVQEVVDTERDDHAVQSSAGTQPRTRGLAPAGPQARKGYPIA